MAVEDFTTYTEVDPNDHITVTASKVTWTNLNRDEDAYVYKDMGVDHFDGDFEHLLEMQLDSTGGSYNIPALVWGVSNDIDDIESWTSGLLCRQALNANDPTERCAIDEKEGGVSDQVSIAASTPYYLKIKRDESAGTYGTLYCYIYTDADRTNLHATLSISLTVKGDYRYLYAACSANNGYTDRVISGYMQNLDLQPGWSGKFLGVTSPAKALGLASPAKVMGVS